MREVPFLRSELLSEAKGVGHAFFTRHGGVSSGLYESLNVGFGSKDDPSRVAENRARAAEALGAPRLNTAYQVHSAEVVTIGVDGQSEGVRVDGVVTRVAGVACGALAADCAPVLIADPDVRVVAAIHAGWRGALDGVVRAGVASMIALGADPDRMLAAVGPCIGPESYEVGPEFFDRFEQKDGANARFFTPPAGNDGKRRFDLPAFVLNELSAAGVGRSHWIHRDTCADADFFSNRRAFHRGEADYGRLLSAIVID